MHVGHLRVIHNSRKVKHLIELASIQRDVHRAIQEDRSVFLEVTMSVNVAKQFARPRTFDLHPLSPSMLMDKHSISRPKSQRLREHNLDSASPSVTEVLYLLRIPALNGISWPTPNWVLQLYLEVHRGGCFHRLRLSNGLHLRRYPITHKILYIYIYYIFQTIVQSINKSKSINQPTNLPTYISKVIPTYLSSIHASIHQSPTYLHIYLPTYINTYLPTYLSIYLSIYLSTCLSVSIYLYNLSNLIYLIYLSF